MIRIQALTPLLLTAMATATATATATGGCEPPTTHGQTGTTSLTMESTTDSSNALSPKTGEADGSATSGSSMTFHPSGTETKGEGSSGSEGTEGQSETGGESISACWSAGWKYSPGPGHSVWGSGPNDVWMVGWREGLGPNVVHFDGLQWQEVELELDNFVPVGVTGSGPEDVYMVAQDGRLLRLQDSWQLDQVVLPDASILAVSPGQVIVVGEGEHYMQRSTEGTWQTLQLPISASLAAVTGTGPDDVFAVGNAGVVMHYTGETWTLLSSPTSADLTGVISTEPGVAIAVGTDGTVWHLSTEDISVLPAPPGGVNLGGVWATGDTQIFAISGHDFFAYNGETWEYVRLPFYDVAASIWGIGSSQLHIGGWSTANLHCRSM